MTPPAIRSRKTTALAASLAVVSALIALALIEALLEIGLRHPPGWESGPVNGVLRRVHMRGEWPMIQLLPECARWDPDLTYVLRPPGCTVADREFTVRYDVNRLGLRDDDASLAAPAVIVLGDSFAMGWGVAQRESFPELLAVRLGVPVLNAGVASYGTARELALLGRFDRSGLRALVLQYCWNDNDENRAWVDGGGRLATRSAEEYQRLVAEHVAAQRYYPFKHLLNLINVLRDRWWPGSHAFAAPPGLPVAQAADDLLTVLAAHRPLFGDRPVVVLVACEHETELAGILRAALASDHWRDLAMVSVVDPAPHIRGEHLYPLDGHWTPQGHAMVADLLAAELARRGVP